MENNETRLRAESALLLNTLAREFEKPEDERDEAFIKKCADLLTAADEENRGPDALK